MTHSKLGEIKLAVVSDIHLGHAKNPAKNIIANLTKAFPDNAETGELDIIFLAGDVFDTLLNMSGEDVVDIFFWIARLLHMCKRRDIMLRVLEGTPSHDWKQSRHFTAINEYAKIGADIRYVTDLSIEYIERLGIRVLYVPDEWKNSTDDTFTEVLALMEKEAVQKVDFAIMHGQFDYQLPPIVRAPKHNEDNYHSIVSEYIFIGHVHMHSQRNRIIAQGSFDRLKHGEEDPKGHVRATVIPGVSRKATFIENTGAAIFKTINCGLMSIEDTLLKIDHEVGFGFAPHSHIRIEGDIRNPIFTNFDILIRKYPLIHWTKLVRSDEVVSIENIPVEEDLSFTPIIINRDNIVELIRDRVRISGIDESVIDACAGVVSIYR